MKKLFFIAAIASAALVSCTKNELAPSVTEQQEISFAAPVMSPTTKVAEIANNYPKDADSKFAVWAYYYDDETDGGEYTDFDDGEIYMNEVVVKYNETLKGWRPESKSYYWPKNGSLTFIAYSPSSVAAYADVDEKGINFTEYVVDTDVAKQTDLLFSERAYDKVEVDQATSAADPYAGVQINFKHALSSILFKVKAAETYTGTTLTVTKIEVLNAYSQGDFTQGLADSNGAVTGATVEGVETKAVWSDYEAETTYVAYENATGLALTNAAVYAHNGTATKTDNTTDLILLPQDLTHSDSDPATPDKEVSIRVTYTLENTDMTDAITQVATVSLANGFKVGETVIDAWEIGKRYTYTISVGLGEIYFDPLVEAWDNNVVTPDVSVN